MVIYLDSLVQLCCKQISLVGVGSALCLGHTGFALLTASVLSQSTLLRLQVAVLGNFLGWALGCVHFPEPGQVPRSTPLRFRFSGTPQRHRLSWACVLCPSQVRAAQATRCLASVLSQLSGVSYHLPGPRPLVFWVCSKSAISGVPCVSSGKLISDCDPPSGCQPSRIPGRLG